MEDPMFAPIILVVFLILVLGLIFYIITIYNGLVILKNNIDKAWSNIDVLLKQRFDELPKLVKVCERYMEHERETLEKVVQARNMLGGSGGGSDSFAAQNAISGALKSLFAVVENYPELKADASFRQLQSRISDIEDQIADRREFFNEAVNLHNTRIEQFPDVLVASRMNLKPRRLWEINPAHREDVNIEFSH